MAESAIVTSVPQTARIWNYLLGGTDNVEADRAVGDEILAALPHLAENARLSRAHLARVARRPTAEAGVRKPGVVSVTRWKPETDAPEIDRYGAVGRKP